MMQLIRQLPDCSDAPTAVAIGNFDGVHLGHQTVLTAMMLAAGAHGLVPSVLTFEPHPRAFFAPHAPKFRLERLAEKLMRLRAAGVQRVYMPRFNASFASWSAKAFLEGVLRQQLGARAVVTGDNFTFGQARGGNVALLQQWGAEKGIDILTVPPVVVDGIACSSSAVRQAVQSGDMPMAATLLGRPYSLQGRVVHGDGRGAGLGFATANISLSPQLKLPAYGVYAVRATLHGKSYDAVANFGVRPTVNAVPMPALEVHLFDGPGMIYGARLQVQFVAKLRHERKFDSLAALTTQIAEDCIAAKQMLNLKV